VIDQSKLFNNNISKNKIGDLRTNSLYLCNQRNNIDSLYRARRRRTSHDGELSPFSAGVSDLSSDCDYSKYVYTEKLNKFILKENRIVRNFRKLNQIERCFEENRGVLKQNFDDLIQNQIAGVKHQKASRKSKKKKKSRKSRESFCHQNDEAKLMNEKRKSDFLEKHAEIQKRPKSQNSSHNIHSVRSNVFSSFDFIEYKRKNTYDILLNSIENILNINSAISAHDYDDTILCTIKIKRIEFSKSMIAFKIQLHVILVNIEKVYTH
jgi:hypothetical protein